MKRTYLVLVGILCSISLWAKNGDKFQAELEGGINAWFVVLNEEEKTCQIGLGVDGYYNNNTTVPKGTSGAIIIPETINGYSVTAIGYGAFEEFSNITSVVIPSTIKEIKSLAFFRCTNLQNITLNEGLSFIDFSSFDGCSKLLSLIIPNSVQKIGSSAFNGCTSLSTVTINNATLTIDDSAFGGCESLSTFEMGNAVTSIGERAFSGCTKLSTMSLPESVSQIGISAFSNSGLTSINIPGRVETLNEYTFSSCKNLTSVTFGDGVKDIGNHCFNECKKLKELSFSNSIKTIGSRCFWGCPSIEELRFPNSLESIGSSAFHNCSSLTSVYFGKGIKSVEDGAFSECTNISMVDIGDLANWCQIEFSPEYGVHGFNTNLGQYISNANPVAYSKKIYLNGKVLDEINIPSTVTSIGSFVFCNLAYLGSVHVPNTISSIGRGAFSGCVNLEEFSFQEGQILESVEDDAFQGCINLTSIELPNTINHLGAAFRSCTNLKNANLPSTITEIAPYTFYECTKLESIVIPDGVKYIGNWAFYKCSGLPRIDIPSNVENIGTEAFCGCTGLTGVYIKDLAKWCSIKYGNFQYQGNNWEPTDKISNPLFYAQKLFVNNQLITDLVIPEGVERIEDFTFNGADIASLTIPHTVKSIGRKAFGYCYNLRSITLPNTIESINEYSFAYLNQQVNKQINKNNVKIYLEDIVSWIKINYGKAFSYLTSLTGGNDIKLELYINNERAKDIVVPTGIVELGEYVFCHTDINSIKLHKNVEKVHWSNFSSSTIKTIYSYSKFAPSFNSSSPYFSSGPLTVVPLTAIYVPKGRSENYKTNWPKHASIIFEMDDSPSEPITFADDEVKRICVENWDTDGDGELSEEEAKAVTDLGTVFKENQLIESFNELQYFTGLTSIGDQAFWYSKSLKSVIIPETITTLGHSAFGECQGLTQVLMPVGIKTMGNQVFVGCKMTSVTLPTSLESIGYACFTGVPIESIHIPASVKDLYFNPFSGCKFLKTITVDTNNTVYYSPEGSNAVIMKETKGLVVGCETTVIPSDVEVIDVGVFEDGVLETLDIPESVTRIRDFSFRRAKIKNITIPKSVTLIEQYAFYGCKNLTDVTVNWEEPIAIEENVFSTRANVVLHVPLGSKAAYEAADVWKDFKEITDEYTEGGVSFASKEDGSLQLSSVDDSSAEVVIPSTLTVDGQEYSVTGIAESAFENNETLERVSIPSQISEIGENAFAGCKNLLAIYNYGENPADLTSTVKVLSRSGEETTVAERVFAEVDLESCVLYVPAGCYQKYRAAEGWNEFLHIREMINGDINGNGVVNELDREAIVNHIMGNSPEGFDVDAADVNKDGNVDVADVVGFTIAVENKKLAKPLSEASSTDVGCVIASDGKVYPAGTLGIAPIAMIVYVGDPGTADKNSSTYRGLAIALSDDGISVKSDRKESGPYNIVVDVQGDLNGLSCPWNKPEREAPEGTSGWFIPSSGQLYLFLKSIGMERHDDYENSEKNRFDLPYYYSKETESEYGYLDEPVVNIVNMLRKAGDLSVEFDYSGQIFWSCTYNGINDRAYYLSFNRGGVHITYGASDAKARFRPFLAF